MKIKPSVNKNVSTAVGNCREVLVTETVNLLKLIGAEQGQDVVFKKMLFLYQHKGNTTEAIICDRIAYAGREGSQPYYIVSMGTDEYVSSVSDMFLSLSSLQTIYDEVRRVVREY
jgi:hypothetical protein